jgi:hypothetical protein
MNFLTLTECKFDSKILAKQPFLLRLNRFEAYDGDVTEVFKALSKSKVINQIRVGESTKFTPESARSLINSSIKYFGIDLKSLDDSTIRVLPGFKRGCRVCVRKGVLSESQKQLFAKNWFLHTKKTSILADVVDTFERVR